jgi:hypothetical protein
MRHILPALPASQVPTVLRQHEGPFMRIMVLGSIHEARVVANLEVGRCSKSHLWKIDGSPGLASETWEGNNASAARDYYP